MAGISVDEQRRPFIVLVWCGDEAPEGVRISHHEEVPGSPGAAPDPSPALTSVDDVDFVAPSLEGNIASVRLDAPGEGWTVEPEPFVLRPGVVYSAFGHRGYGSSQVNIGGFTFSAESVAKLKPGSVLLQAYDERWPSPDRGDVVVSSEEFKRQGQDPAQCE
ncbi:hypothetical protein ACFYY8_29805 [Streptosporangium sp. NPDC001559]|uniref:hypothetical protein n=1 Tax=Streptosporangium sp. NPDC001559 TaxID=3366187 RepID=UPI0036F0F971